MEIREIDGIVLQDVTNADGPIYVIAGGEITAVWVECLTDLKGNNVGLMSLGGDIVVDYVGVGSENCQISLSAAGDIWEADDHDADVDLRGALGILYAEGRIDHHMGSEFARISRWGQKYALYEFERGQKLNLVYIQGDVELFFTLENKVHVYATGNIHVTYLDTNGRDIYLKSKYGDISLSYLNSGPCKGDITLKADNSVFLAGKLYSGDMGHIITGDDLSIYAGGDIEIFGTVSASDDIKMESADGEVYIDGPVSAGDSIDINADENLIISAPIEAGGDLDLYAKYSLATINDLATLTAGADVELETRYGTVELWGAISAGNGFIHSSFKHCKCHEEGPDVLIDSGSELYIHGAIHSQDDVEIWADDGVFIDAPITAVDEIEIGTCGSLTTTASADLSTGDDIELYARQVLSIGAAVSAGDDVDVNSCSDVQINGKVSAGDDVKVYARSDIEVASTIEAADRIYLRAGGNLTLFSASLLTGTNGDEARIVYLRAGDTMTLAGDINAEKVVVC
jgi:hypothetical protein